MLPEITGGCVRYDKIAFVLFPVGSPGFLRFLRFQTVTGGLRADIAQKVKVKFAGETILDKDKYGIAVAHGNQEMVKKVNEALKEVKRSGEYKNIYSSYFGN